MGSNPIRVNFGVRMLIGQIQTKKIITMVDRSRGLCVCVCVAGGEEGVTVALVTNKYKKYDT